MAFDQAAPYRYVQRSSTHLLIWFGGHCEPMVSDRHFDDVGLSSLNVIDQRMDWLTNGLEGVTASDAETVAWLRETAAGRPVICGGQSSGGYAAIRYGHALDASLIVALAPQTGRRTAHAPGYPLLALDQLYLEQPRSHPISIHLSRSERQSAVHGFWDDHLHAQALAAVANVTIHQHPYDSHAVSLYLNHHGCFLDVVKHDMLWHRLTP
jgi:hypothetical protein